MHHAQTTKEKIHLFLKILWPILITQVGYQLMPLFDTILSGQYSPADLAGVAIGASLWSPVFVLFNGMLLSVTPIVSQLVGAGKRESIAPAVMQAIYLAGLVGLFVIALGAVLLEPVLALMDLEPKVHHVAKHFLIALSFGIIPLFISTVIRNFFDAQGLTHITMIIILICVPINIALCYVFINGKLGFLELGGIGSGYATAITYWLILFISVAMTFLHQDMRTHRLFRRWPLPSWKAWKEQLTIGVPMGLSTFFEASTFAVMTLLVGAMFDTATVAAHQAANSWSGMVFMMPLSISIALTILVGFEVGAGRMAHAKKYSVIGVSSAVGIIALFAIMQYFTRGTIASFFTDEPHVAVLIEQFLIFVIFFQLSDASQASLQGALRGYKDVTLPFIIAFISYWAVGIPTGTALAAWTPLGPYGFWVGIIAGLTCAAVGFFLRLRYIQSRQGH